MQQGSVGAYYMFVSRRKLGLLAAVGLLLVAVLLAACAEEHDVFGPTTTTTIFPSQRSFVQELSGDGYRYPIVFTKQEGDTRVLLVWVPVDLGKANRATNDAIFDHALALAKKYGAADSTGGRLRVGLIDYRSGGSADDNIFESRDFDLSGD